VAEGVRERGVDLGDRDVVARSDLLWRVVAFDVALLDVMHADAVSLDPGVPAEDIVCLHDLRHRPVRTRL